MSLLDLQLPPGLSPFQQDLLRRGRNAYSDEARRVLWQAPCGFGKTWVAAEQTRRALALGKRVLHIVHRRRLVDQMIRTLADFGIHASPLMQGRVHWKSPVICASRDTLLAMLADGQALPSADLIIWDEAHVAARLLWDYYLERHPYAFWTGHTATPVGSDGRSLSPPYQALVCAAPPSELIRAGRLCPVKVYNPDGVRRRRLKGDRVSPVGCPVQHWKKYAEDSPTVVFAATVRQSLDLVGKYRAAGITAEHIDASTNDGAREDVFARSERGETKVICNVGVLVEGVDLPWLRCAQFLRGCNSLVLWKQGNGRVMRAHPGKEYAICLDHAGAAHEFYAPDFDTVWTLDDERAVVRNNKLPKDRQPLTCPKCGLVFNPKPACPECGHVLPKKRRSALSAEMEGEDGVLTLYTGQASDILADKLERLFKKCYFIGCAKGWSMSRVAAVFAREAGMPAWEAGLRFPLPPRGDAAWKRSAKDWRLEQERSA